MSQPFVWVDTSQPTAAKVNVQLAAGVFVSGSDECRCYTLSLGQHLGIK